MTKTKYNVQVKYQFLEGNEFIWPQVCRWYKIKINFTKSFKIFYIYFLFYNHTKHVYSASSLQSPNILVMYQRLSGEAMFKRTKI